MVAAPQYFEHCEQPTTPDDLKHHNCIVYSLLSSINIWHFTKQNKKFAIPVKGNFQSSNGDTNLEVALSGLGIVQLPIWMVDQHLKSGKLIQLLTDYQGISIPLNAIYPQNRYVPLKVKCFIDYLKQQLSSNDVLSTRRI